MKTPTQQFSRKTKEIRQWLTDANVIFDPMDFGGGKIPTYVYQALINPECWQAVGKTRGWEEQSNYPLKASFGPHRIIRRESGNEWQWQMHRFIDHLADGKDTEQALQAIS